MHYCRSEGGLATVMSFLKRNGEWTVAFAVYAQETENKR